MAKATINRTSRAFGDKIGMVAAWLGCWHTNLSRPFTNAEESYRVCLRCGARRHFNAETLQTFGAFHYPPSVSVAEPR